MTHDEVSTGHVPQLTGNYWNSPVGIEKLKGRKVRVHFKDTTQFLGRVIGVDGDLGTITIAWSEGPRNYTCNFKIQDVLSVKVEE